MKKTERMKRKTAVKKTERMKRRTAVIFAAWVLLSAVGVAVLLAVGQTPVTVWTLRIYSCVLTPVMVGAVAYLSQKARKAERKGA